MRTGVPRTALQAVTWRRLAISGWPWRSTGYLLATLPVAAVAAAGLAIPAVPWFVLAAGGFQAATIVTLILLGAVGVAALGPLVSIPAIACCRWRLRIVDKRPARPAGRRVPDSAGPVAWLRSRYTDPVAWRETGYACLLATVTHALCAVALLAVLLVWVLISSPVIVDIGGGPVALVFGQIYTVRQAVPYAIVGVVVLPLVPYLLTLAAGADAAVARALLFDDAEDRLRIELTEVTASRARLADAFEAERRRIERDLHDGAQQKLVALTMQLGLAKLDLPSGSPAAASVAVAHEQAKQLMAELRELIHGIQPQILTDLGLPAALEELADRAPVPVTVTARLDRRPPPAMENTAYFVAAEALTNVAKHSGATRASLTVSRHRDTLVVEISDNGQGGAGLTRGSGLTGLADRVAVAGGRMLLSSPPGGPTVLRVEVPCGPKSPAYG
ncbi:MAG TPA: sensor domain-containing protein [Trebonia sp.]|nr:sensor domain-containing protein [Trebonia sp.]